MNIYLGTLNHILDATVKVEPKTAIDGPLICVQIVFEEHSGVPGDRVTFRCPLESISKLRGDLYWKLLLLVASYGREDSLFPSDDCPSCGTTYGSDHKPDCLCVAALAEKKRLGIE